MSSAVLLLAMGLAGQAPVGGAFVLQNQIQDQAVRVWIREGEAGPWLYDKKPVVLRARQSARLNLPAGRYRLYLRTESNSTLVMDRKLARGELDRLRIGDPPPVKGMVASPQVRVYQVRDNYGRTEYLNSPPMEVPKPPVQP